MEYANATRDDGIAWANTLEFEWDKVMAVAIIEIETQLSQSMFENEALKLQLAKAKARAMETGRLLAVEQTARAISDQALLEAQS